MALSTLPKVLLEIRHEELEKTAKHIGWDISYQLPFRRGGFSVLVKRVAKYEVPGETGPTVVSVPQPETLFPRGLLHSSVVAYILVQKFGLGVSALMLAVRVVAGCHDPRDSGAEKWL